MFHSSSNFAAELKNRRKWTFGDGTDWLRDDKLLLKWHAPNPQLWRRKRNLPRNGWLDVYKRFFGLRENPFNTNPGGRYIFFTPKARGTLEGMVHALQMRKSLILLTGEVGTGKTMLINRLLTRVRALNMPSALVFNSRLETNHLFDFILADFGVPPDPGCDGNPRLRLNRWLIERHRAGQSPVLIIDEAQGLPTHVLEEIRLLLNLETPHEKLLQIVLCGQPELEDRLKQADLRQLKQRINLRCKTTAFDEDEARDYIQARLRVAGANGTPIFEPDAIDAVYFYSRGIPRIINLLCEHSLMNAYTQSIQPVPERIVAEVARQFQFDDKKPVSPFRASGEMRITYSSSGDGADTASHVAIPDADGARGSGDTSSPRAAEMAPRETSEPCPAVAGVTESVSCEERPELSGFVFDSAPQLLVELGFMSPSASSLSSSTSGLHLVAPRQATQLSAPAFPAVEPGSAPPVPVSEPAVRVRRVWVPVKKKPLVALWKRNIRPSLVGVCDGCARAYRQTMRFMREPLPAIFVWRRRVWRSGFAFDTGRIKEMSHRWLMQPLSMSVREFAGRSLGHRKT